MHKFVLPSWEETIAALRAEQAKPYPYDKDKAALYRGHHIVEEGPGDFTVYSGRYVTTRCGSHWSCICYIDELLAP